MINKRIFSANVGDTSTGNAGPDAIENDIENLLLNDQELLGIIGDKTNLNTTDKTNLVAAINEHETDLTKSLRQISYLQSAIGTTGSLNNLGLGIYNVGGWYSMTDYPMGAYGYGVLIVIEAHTTGGKAQLYFPDNRDFFYFRNGFDSLYRAWHTIPSATQPNWITATLQNGWTGALQYRKNQIGQIELNFNITPGTITAGTVITTLPEGYRPSRVVVVPVYNGTSSAVGAYIVVGTSGNIIVPTNGGITGSSNYNGEYVFTV